MLDAIADDELLRRSIAGDHASLDELLTRCAPELRRRLQGRISPRWQAVLSDDDVLQQTYADAIEDIQRLEARGMPAFVNWLAALAERNLVDAIREFEADKRGGDRRQVLAVPTDDSFVALHELLAIDSSTPSRGAARRELRSVLERALERLPDDYRRVVDLYDLQGQPIEAVAQSMGRSPGACFMLHARALSRLREQLGTGSKFFSGSS